MEDRGLVAPLTHNSLTSRKCTSYHKLNIVIYILWYNHFFSISWPLMLDGYGVSWNSVQFLIFLFCFYPVPCIIIRSQGDGQLLTSFPWYQFIDPSLSQVFVFEPPCLSLSFTTYTSLFPPGCSRCCTFLELEWLTYIFLHLQQCLFQSWKYNAGNLWNLFVL